MEERKGIVTMKGNPITLVGKEINIGEVPEDVELTATDLSTVKLSSYKGKICVISCVPSLDTPICDLQTRRFNTEASKLGEHIVILTISMDLPFAQKRWCGAAGVDKVVTLSDHRSGDFGKAFGVLIKEFRLLARAVFILDTKGVVQYRQIVKEIGQEPDYNDVINALKNISK